MPRVQRQAPGGVVYHVLNRGVGRMTLFETGEDYAAFERVMRRSQDCEPGVRLLAYCLMPNHWHLLLWPRENGELGRFMQRLTITHARRWQEHREAVGSGHVYQGRFKSFPVQTDGHFLTVARYIERNALRAGLVSRAEDWRWGSLSRWMHNRAGEREEEERPALSAWPVERPRHWRVLVNTPLNDVEMEALRSCVQRGRPFGSEKWIQVTARRLGLDSTFRRRGRPRAGSVKESS
ncbi:MAG: transposase [Planctomycetota bacterium]|nr:transposase [Planctomycetota bacterium]